MCGILLILTPLLEKLYKIGEIERLILDTFKVTDLIAKTIKVRSDK
jgi:hypothetical protein